MSKGETFVSLFDKVRKSCPDSECYVSYDGNMERRHISFKELWVLASRFSHNLQQYGVQKGDNVVVATPLSIEYIVASFGVIFAGGCQVSMEKLFADGKALKNTINMTKAKFIILAKECHNETWPVFEPKSTRHTGHSQATDYKDDEMPSLNKIIFTDKPKADQDVGGFLNYLRGCTSEYRNADIVPADSCASPSSLNPAIGTPKVIELSHRAVVNTARLWGRITYFGAIHMWFPWYIAITLPHDALNGRPRIITDNYFKSSISPCEHHKRVIEAEGLSDSIMAPPDIKTLAKLYEEGHPTVLKNIITGGQPMNKEICEVAKKLSSNIYIFYLVSESNIVSCNHIPPGETFEPFDAGFPVQGVEVRILDDDDKEVLQGKTGRIAIRSPYQFTRYPGQPELTESVWKEDGWFHTQDAGCLTADGRLHVYGRRGDVISRGIVLTYPSWIEIPILKIHDVIEVMAVPIPDDINFQNTCACVILRPGSKMTEADILSAFKDSITDDAKEFINLDYVLIFQGDALPRLPRDKMGQLAAEKLGLAKTP